MTRVQYQEFRESGVLGNTYVLDASVTPIDDLSLTGSFTREELATKTPATADPTRLTPLPGFNSDVDTWLFSLDYAPKSNLSFVSAVSYSRADNFNDFANIGIPLGAEYNRVGVTLGVKWTLKHNVSVEPLYEFYHYGADERADGSSYNASVVGLEVSAPWG
jgi:hypothetical protein